jgi:hypothetical protein
MASCRKIGSTGSHTKVRNFTFIAKHFNSEADAKANFSSERCYRATRQSSACPICGM